MIIAVYGSQGSGKTLFVCKEAFIGHLQGKKVYSNFRLNFPHEILKFDDVINTRLENATVIIDECHLWGGFSARQSMSSRNQKMIQFISQCRKAGITLFLTTQLPRNLDVVSRENCSIYIFMSKKVFIKGAWVNAVEGCDYDHKLPVMITQEVLHLGTEKTFTLSFEANKYFGLYDTQEVIKLQ
jgi:hypothetical protein